jgi:hypothetical protein
LAAISRGTGGTCKAQSPLNPIPDPLRGVICLSLAMRFEKDRARLGLHGAVDQLRDLLAHNGLTLDSDERLLAGVLEGSVSSAQLAKAISPRRMGLVKKALH